MQRKTYVGFAAGGELWSSESRFEVAVGGMRRATYRLADIYQCG